MVKTAFLLILFYLAIIFLLQCPAEPPSGPYYDVSSLITLNSCLYTEKDTQKIWLSVPSEDFFDSDNRNLSITGATITVNVDNSSFSVEEIQIPYADLENSDRYLYYKSYYLITGIKPQSGQQWEINVSHPQYKSVTASTRVPYPVKFIYISLDTLNADEKFLSVKWDSAGYAFGYLPRLYLVGERDSLLYKFEIYKSVIDDGIYEDFTPILDTEARIDIKDILKQFRELGLTLDKNKFNKFWLQFEIYSLNDALYYSEYSNTPDPIAGISVPVQNFSNVQGGVGILAAYQKAISPPIIVPPEMILDY